MNSQPSTNQIVDNLRSITKDKIRLSLDEHRLPDSYAEDLDSFLLPVAEKLSQQHKGEPLIVGIQGSQGSGKSTSAAFLKLILECEYDLSVAICSIDDFYLSRTERQTLAESVHPLLQTRGVPGTHRTDLIDQQFQCFKSKQSLFIPQFEKAMDDPKPQDQWLSIRDSVDLLIFEGWCVGITPQQESELSLAVNELESQEDADLVWRKYVNDKLATEYTSIFSQLDVLIALQAPSFDCVFEWRQLQEQKLIDSLESQGKGTELTLSPVQVKRFIQHYQRLTEHGLKSLKQDANYVLELNADHRITALLENSTGCLV